MQCRAGIAFQLILQSASLAGSVLLFFTSLGLLTTKVASMLGLDDEPAKVIHAWPFLTKVSLL